MVKKRNTNKAKQKEEKEKGALFIPASLFLGMGWGFLSGNFVEGLFFGLGLGFLLFAIVNLVKKKK